MYVQCPLWVREINPRCHATSGESRHSWIYDDLLGYRKFYSTFVNIAKVAASRNGKSSCRIFNNENRILRYEIRAPVVDYLIITRKNSITDFIHCRMCRFTKKKCHFDERLIASTSRDYLKMVGNVRKNKSSQGIFGLVPLWVYQKI